MPKTITVKEAADTLKVSDQTIWRYLKSGQLLGRKVGRQYLITEESVEKLQEPEPVAPPTRGAADA